MCTPVASWNHQKSPKRAEADSKDGEKSTLK